MRNDTLAEWLRRRPAEPTNTSLEVLHPLALIFLIPPARPTGSSLHTRTPPSSSDSFPSFLFPYRPASRPHASDDRSPIFMASHFHLFSPSCLLSFSWFRGPSCYLNPLATSPCLPRALPPRSASSPLSPPGCSPHQTSCGFEPRSLDSASRILIVTPRSHMTIIALIACVGASLVLGMFKNQQDPKASCQALQIICNPGGDEWG